MSTPTYIAIEDIFVARGVMAFAKGQSVPASVVENLGVQDKVASDRTKAAASAVRDAAKVSGPSPS